MNRRWPIVFKSIHYPLCIICMLCSPPLLNAQQTSSQLNDNVNLQQVLENSAEQAQQEEGDYSSLVEELLYYAAHPINLNRTSKEELQALHLLTDVQIAHLFTHMDKNGPLLIIYELQAIEGFDLVTIQQLLPYVSVSDKTYTAQLKLKKIMEEGEQAFTLRYGQVIEKQLGFTPIDSAGIFKSPNARYIGSPQKVYARYRFAYSSVLSFGITAEKDQGELFFKSNQAFRYDWYNQSLKEKQRNGFDFYSAHLFLHNFKRISALAIGDYQVCFGQGLTAWTGMSFGKSSEILYTKKSANAIRPYTSVDENKFMRGIATSIQLKKFTISSFYSRKAVDANVTDTLEDGAVAVISSLQQTGSHATPSELADKHAVRQCIYGGNIAYRSNHASLGITAVHSHLDAFLQPRVFAYNQFEKENSNDLNIGCDYNFILHNFNFFGEAAHSRNGGIAFLNGFFISLDPRLSFTFLQRSYQRNYQNNTGAAFAESSGTNEKGIYIGIAGVLTHNVTFTGYCDHFEFPWLKYQVDAPSRGSDYCMQLNFTPSKRGNLTVRVRQHNKQKNSSDANSSMNSLLTETIANYRFTFTYSVFQALKFRNRVDVVRYQLNNDKQSGYLLYQDILYNKPGKAFSATARYALFQTDAYDSRLYEFENDIPGSYSIPNYSGRGARFYMLLSYRINKHMECWLRYARTVYDDKEVISEGSLSEIDGNTKSEVNVQLVLKW